MLLPSRLHVGYVGPSSRVTLDLDSWTGDNCCLSRLPLVTGAACHCLPPVTVRGRSHLDPSILGRGCSKRSHDDFVSHPRVAHSARLREFFSPLERPSSVAVPSRKNASKCPHPCLSLVAHTPQAAESCRTLASATMVAPSSGPVQLGADVDGPELSLGPGGFADAEARVDVRASATGLQPAPLRPLTSPVRSVPAPVLPLLASARPPVLSKAPPTCPGR